MLSDNPFPQGNAPVQFYEGRLPLKPPFKAHSYLVALSIFGSVSHMPIEPHFSSDASFTAYVHAGSLYGNGDTDNINRSSYPLAESPCISSFDSHSRRDACTVGKPEAQWITALLAFYSISGTPVAIFFPCKHTSCLKTGPVFCSVS